eukprot:COSAG01_NODE_963_length_12407_cov_38.330598_20_plen_114_part_00
MLGTGCPSTRGRGGDTLLPCGGGGAAETLRLLLLGVLTLALYGNGGQSGGGSGGEVPRWGLADSQRTRSRVSALTAAGSLAIQTALSTVRCVVPGRGARTLASAGRGACCVHA